MRFILWAVCVLACLTTFAQTKSNTKASSQEAIPLNPKVHTGVLANGLTYYTLENKKPEHRAELRLVVNAGSLQENDSQQGLAHLTEHMGFNGTKHFPHSDLVNFLESAGARFGPDLNAYTSFDETVYMLQIPTDTAGRLEKGLQILEDWSHDVTFDKEEVQKERGVVVEEWRLGQGAEERMRRKYYPVLYKDSRYAVRLPIGKKEIVEQAPYDTLVKFYKDWYRPDLEAVVVVGDVDASAVEKMIREKFGDIPKRTKERPREHYKVPVVMQLLTATATDKEAQYGRVQIQYWQPPQSYKTVADFQDRMTDELIGTMLSDRLNEIRLQPNAPFNYAYGWHQTSTHTNSAYVNMAYCDPKKINDALTALLDENERIKRYGFTQSELERAKKSILTQLEQQFNERDKTESKALVGDLVDLYLDDEAAPGIAWDYAHAQTTLPRITLNDVNGTVKSWITNGRGCVVVLTAPDKDGVALPTDAQIHTAYYIAKEKKLDAYNDAVDDKPLFSDTPKPGTVVSAKVHPTTGITEWKLSNGATVLLKPTDFKNDEILFDAFANGGVSVYDDKEVVDAQLADNVSNNSGFGTYNKINLEKYLSDKTASVHIFIDDLTQSVGGESGRKDVETLFQLINLAFTAPRKDTAGFESAKAAAITFIQNRSNSPRGAFADTVQSVMSSHSPRAKPMTEPMINAASLDNIYRIVRERYANAGAFTFVFVGSFDTAVIKPYVLKYIASLPSSDKTEKFVDRNVHAPKGHVERSVYKGSEPQSNVSMQFTGDAPYSRNDAIDANALAQLMNIRLREKLREDMSGTYGVRCGISLAQFPRQEFTSRIDFGSSPDNVQKLIAAAKQVIDSVKTNGCNKTDLQKVKELMIKARETDLKENNFWLQYIRNSVFNRMPVEDVTQYAHHINTLRSDDFKRLALLYFNDTNLATFVLYPGKK